jgi:nucleotide-binding universal stress UspA family protein
MKIILATDGTRFGDAATEMITKFNLGSGDSVRVISVVDMALPLAVDVYGGYLPDTSDLEKTARENASKVTDSTCEKIRSFFGQSGVDVSGEVLFGSPDSRIVETAENMGADLIILGSHGYRRWERILLGSVSSSVVSHAHCSVLVVRSADQPVNDDNA